MNNNVDWIKEFPGYNLEKKNQLINRLRHTDHCIDPSTYDYFPLHLTVVEVDAPTAIVYLSGVGYSMAMYSRTYADLPETVNAITKQSTLASIIGVYMVIDNPDGTIRVRYGITERLLEAEMENIAKFNEYRAQEKI